jgi:hypothetical protein
MKKRITYLMSILAIGFFIFLAYGSDDDGESSSVDLNASVSFSGTQFVITNNDTFDYNNAKLEVNGDYVLKGYNLKSGETYTVGIMQFADSDGNRFTLMKKPQKFSIWCDLGNGKNGFYYATWN